MANTNACASPDAKKQMRGDMINDATSDLNCSLTLIAEGAHAPENFPQNEDLGNDAPNGTSARKSHGVGEQLEATVDKHIRDPIISDHNDVSGVNTPTLCGGPFSSTNPENLAPVPKSDYVVGSTLEGTQTPLKNSVLDHNDNLPSTDTVESKLPLSNSDINFSLAEIETNTSQDEGKMGSLEARTHDLVVHDTSVEEKEPAANGENAQDVPVYKKKLQRRKDKKKNDRIEKTFFV